MARYLVENSIPGAGELTRAELKAIVEQSLRVQRELESEMQWIHSMITAERMVSLYTADDEATIREHALRSGLPISRISEVKAVIGPASDIIS